MATDEKKKRPAAHEAIIKILTEATGKSIGSYLFAFADMYGLGAVAPAKAIPELIEAFRKALGSISEEKEAEPWMANIVNLSVKELQAQLAEARSKECIKSIGSTGAILDHKPKQAPNREEIRQAIIQRLLDIEYPPGTKFHKEDSDTWDIERQSLVLKVGWNNMSLEELVAGLQE